MRNFLLFSLSVIAIFTLMQCSPYGGPDPVDIFAAKIARDISKKYRLESVGIGGGATKEGVWLVDVRFTYHGEPLGINEGRKLIVAITEEFLETFNKNQEIIPLLKVHPFVLKNICIGIFLKDSEGNDVFDPYLDIILVSHDSIRYFTQDNQDRRKIKSLVKEPYVEALEKVKADKYNL